MSKYFAGLGAGSGVAAAAVIGVAIVGLGAWMHFGGSLAPEKVTDAALPLSQQSKPAATPAMQPDEPKAEDAAAPETAEAEVVPPTAPAFDEVRREEDGMTVIAGRAEPGAAIKVLQNGIEIAMATADTSGKFATLTMIPPDGQGHVLSLLQVFAGEEQASDDQIILAPLAAPVEIAEAPKDDVVEPEAPAQEGDSPIQGDTVDVAEADPVEDGTTGEEQNESAVAKITDDAGSSDDVSVSAEAAPVETPETPNVAEVDETALENDVETADTPNATEATPADKPVETAALDTETAELATDEPAETSNATAPESANTTTPTTSEAPERVAVLKATEDGVELLNPVAPEVMDNVAIDTISYSSAGAVELAGRAQSQAETVRVYLDNDSVVSLPVDDQGRWRGSLPNVDEGIYTLRVDEVAADGSVTSRVETPFKREPAELLVAASAGQDGPLKAITVQKGATLWAIARDRYGSGELYVRVFEANKTSIRDPDLIYPGQIFDLPE